MLDILLRPVKERLLTPLALAIGRRVLPMAVTLAAFVAGIAAAAFAAHGKAGAALACWIANRALDGFDGTLARAQHSQSDFGGYTDVLLDFVVYAAIPIGLVFGAPSAVRTSLAVAALFLASSFYVNAASWMYLAAILERRDAGARTRGELTSITMPEGLIGGSETVLLYTTFFLLPAHLVLLFGLMSVLVLATAGQRFMWAARRL